MTEQKTYATPLTKVNDTFYPMIEEQLNGNGIDMDQYSKQCVINALSSINDALDQKGIDWNNPQLDHSNITQILLNVASLKLNAAADPNEVYFQIRNVKYQKRDQNGKTSDDWRKQIEMGIEGDGNDAILARFGRGVRDVHQHWLVRENDGFDYPTYRGLEIEPPKWQPQGSGKVIRVVYPIEKTNGVVEYHISERADVLKNLIAHVKNNMMNEAFGIAQNRYKATPQQKQQIDDKKAEIVEAFKAKGLDAALDDPELNKYVSPAWKDEQSRESMIIRKMRNNAVKGIPKDFGAALIEQSYHDSTADNAERVRKDVTENANNEVLDQMDEPADDAAADPETPKQPASDDDDTPKQPASDDNGDDLPF